MPQCFPMTAAKHLRVARNTGVRNSSFLVLTLPFVRRSWNKSSGLCGSISLAINWTVLSVFRRDCDIDAQASLYVLPYTRYIYHCLLDGTTKFMHTFSFVEACCNPTANCCLKEITSIVAFLTLPVQQQGLFGGLFEKCAFTMLAYPT